MALDNINSSRPNLAIPDRNNRSIRSAGSMDLAGSSHVAPSLPLGNYNHLVGGDDSQIATVMGGPEENPDAKRQRLELARDASTAIASGNVADIVNVCTAMQSLLKDASSAVQSATTASSVMEDLISNASRPDTT